MAQHLSRAERSGSIFYRITGMLRSGQMKWDQRPIWYDVYAALPPLREPVWDMKMPKEEEPVRPIFYQEDVVRAEFYRTFRATGYLNTLSGDDGTKKSVIERFLGFYEEIKIKNPGLTDKEAFEETEKAMVEAGVNLTKKAKTMRVGIGGTAEFR